MAKETESKSKIPDLEDVKMGKADRKKLHDAIDMRASIAMLEAKIDADKKSCNAVIQEVLSQYEQTGVRVEGTGSVSMSFTERHTLNKEMLRESMLAHKVPVNTIIKIMVESEKTSSYTSITFKGEKKND